MLPRPTAALKGESRVPAPTATTPLLIFPTTSRFSAHSVRTTSTWSSSTPHTVTMDPLSSLSVASSAIQILDFSSKLWKRFRQLYQSEDGATVAQEALLSDAKRLCSLNSGLSKLLTPDNLQRMPTSTEENVVSLCNECDEAAEGLVTALQELTLNDQEFDVRGWARSSL